MKLRSVISDWFEVNTYWAHDFFFSVPDLSHVRTITYVYPWVQRGIVPHSYVTQPCVGLSLSRDRRRHACTAGNWNLNTRMECGALRGLRDLTLIEFVCLWEKCCQLFETIPWSLMNVRQMVWMLQLLYSFVKSNQVTMCVQIVTGEFVVDLGRGLRWKKKDHPLFVTSNRCISVKNTLGWSAVVFCACEIMQVFSV
jgi:hypothetical protein